MNPLRKSALSVLAALLSASVLLLSGCDGFFVSPNGSSSGSGNYAYVANTGSNTVAGYSIGSGGSLTAVSGSPYSLSYTPTAVVVSRNNKYLYVGTVNGIYGFTIGSAGQLTAISSGQLLATTATVSLDVSPDGKWLISLNGNISSTVNAFQINSDGTLGSGTTFLYTTITTAALPHEIHISPNGNYLFATVGTGGTMRFTFNTSTGAIAASGNGIQVPVDSTTSDMSLAIDKNSQYLYMARTGNSPGLTVYQITSGGGLTQVGSTYTTGLQSYSVAIGNNGADVYVANRGDNNISGFVVGSNGALTKASGSPYTAGSSVTSLAADSSNTYLLAASYGGSPDLQAFTYGSSGAITSAASISTGSLPGYVAVTH